MWVCQTPSFSLQTAVNHGQVFQRTGKLCISNLSIACLSTAALYVITDRRRRITGYHCCCVCLSGYSLAVGEFTGDSIPGMSAKSDGYFLLWRFCFPAECYMHHNVSHIFENMIYCLCKTMIWGDICVICFRLCGRSSQWSEHSWFSKFCCQIVTPVNATGVG